MLSLDGHCNSYLTKNHYCSTHTTSATAVFLWHLLHSPQIMCRCVAEPHEKLPELSVERPAYSMADVESSLSCLQKCVKENVRIAPVCTMSIANRSLDLVGITIRGSHLPSRSFLVSATLASYNPTILCTVRIPLEYSRKYSSHYLD